MTERVESPHAVEATHREIKLAICDDSPLARNLLAHYFESRRNYDVRTASNPDDLKVLCQSWQPDVVLFDLYYMPNAAPALAGATEVRSVSPNTKVLVLSYSPAEGDVLDALESFDGYLTKDTDLDELDRAVGLALSGTQYVDPRVASHLRGGASLTDSEATVLQALADGQRLADIADLLPPSARTGKALSSRQVRRLAETARTKIGARSTAEAIAEAQRRRLIR